MSVLPIDDGLLPLLACPEDHAPLEYRDQGLVCEHGHRFLVEQGIPVLTGHARREPTPANMPPCPRPLRAGAVDPFVNDWLVNTNGNIYRRARGILPRYPVPDWPLPAGERRMLVDVGCSWGRWSVAAARAGYRPVGIDVHFDALAAGVRVSRQLGVEVRFVCGDAERLPIRTASADAVFCYSVLQHMEKQAVREALCEFARVLKPGGICLVQLPNRYGVVSGWRQARRGFREAGSGTFGMRYWSRSEIRAAFDRAGLRALAFRADGFFTQNPQLADLDLLSSAGKVVVLASHAARQVANHASALVWIADSLWIEAHAPQAQARPDAAKVP